MEKLRAILLLILLSTSIISCSGANSQTSDEEVKLIFGAYTTPREAYGEIIRQFKAYWQSETGQSLVFDVSYLGSGAQSRAVVDGFEADIVALSLEADINRIKNAGLITHDWKSGPYQGIVTRSIVTFAVRKGNPKSIQDWVDLTQPGLEILTPNPTTSGGAMWNILAMYGAALRGQIDGVPADDPEAAAEFMGKVLENVTVMDKAARDSILNFEKGIGDVAITYENEILVGRESGQSYERVIPSSTILIENPIALVDSNVDAHGTREVAGAFLDFVFTKEAQQVYAAHGLRVVHPEVAEDTEDQYPPVSDLFTVEYFGGWEKIMQDIFGESGVYTQTIFKVHGEE
jgi:sulfate transport system substrate-binding protein